MQNLLLKKNSRYFSLLSALGFWLSFFSLAASGSLDVVAEEGHEGHGHEEKTDHGNEAHQEGEKCEDEEKGKEEGFEISKQALKIYGISLISLSGSQPFSVPLTALVSAQDRYLLYRQRGKEFKEIELQVLSVGQGQAQVKSPELRGGDRVAVSGSPFLRVISLNSQTSHRGHCH